MKEWTVRMRLSFNATVIINAASEKEAEEKANGALWDDDGMNCAEMVDWGVIGRPVEE